MTKKILSFSALSLIGLIVGLYFSFQGVSKPTQTSVQAAPLNTSWSSLGIDNFKRDFQTLKKYLTYTKRIRLNSNMLEMSEFDDNVNLYAGHLGSFWSPPFYSSHIIAYSENSSDWRKGFNMGLAFFDRTTKASSYEQPSNPLTEAFWYPSKIVMSKDYQFSTPFKISSVKAPIPGSRAFGLKVTIKNLSSTSTLNQNILFTSSVSSFNRGGNWTWHTTPSSNTSQDSYYLQSSNTLIVKNTSGDAAYMGITLDRIPSAWSTDDKSDQISSEFKSSTNGSLSKVDRDTTTTPGTANGLVASLDPISPNGSTTLTYLVAVSDSEAGVLNSLNSIKGKNIEELTDSFWNERLSSLYARVPRFENVSNDFSQIYYNSWLNLLINKWEFGSTDSLVQDKKFYSLSGAMGGSMGIWPWSMMNFSQALAIYDPEGLKESIRRVIKLNLSGCQGYNPVNNSFHKCGGGDGYSFNPTSVVQMFHDYLSVTSDVGFLNESVTQGGSGVTKPVKDWIKSYADYGDLKAGSAGELADYGHDKNLFEYSITYGNSCSIAGLYTGKVPAPNAERYLAHLQMADVYSLLGDSSSQANYLSKASQTRNAVNGLWNNSLGWFDSISLYNADQSKRATPYRNTFWGIQIFPLLGYEHLLTPSQSSAIFAHLNEFKNSSSNFGYTSLPFSPRRHAWCVRPDWQGPGLYSGEMGLLLTSLAKAGYSDEVYNMVFPSVGTGYRYLKDAPYWSQSFLYDAAMAPGLVSGNNVGYIDGVSVAQSFIEGIFGFDPQAKQIRISPKIPAALNGAKITNVNLKGHGMSYSFLPGTHSLNIQVDKNSSAPARSMQFRFSGSGSLEATLTHLVPNASYNIVSTKVSDSTVWKTTVSTDSLGKITVKIPISSEHQISVSSSEYKTYIPVIYKNYSTLGSKFASGISCRNLSNSSPANLTLSFFQMDSSNPVLTFNEPNQLAPGAEKLYYTPSSPVGLADNFIGSVVVTSTQEIYCSNNFQSVITGVGSVSIPARVATNLATKQDSTSSKLFTPQLMRDFSGWNSFVSVQNADTQPLNVTISYVDRSGVPLASASETVTLTPNSSHIFYQAQNSKIPPNFLGGATITANGIVTGTGRIAATTFFYNSATNNTTSQFHGYNAFSAGSSKLYVPRFVRNSYGYNSGLTIQNVGTQATTVSVEFKFNNISYVRNVGSISPGSSVALYAPNIAELNPLDSQVVSRRNGSAIVTAAGGGQIVALINEDNRGSCGSAICPTIPSNEIGSGSSYNAIPEISGTITNVVFLTQITRRVGGSTQYSGLFQVMNTSPNGGLCSVEYSGYPLANEGNIQISGYGMLHRYAPDVINLPDGFNGSIKVSCNVPIVGMASNGARHPSYFGDTLFTVNGLNQ